MKMLKVSDEMHRLVMAETGSATDVLLRWSRSLPDRTDLNTVLDQMNMRFDAMESLFSHLYPMTIPADDSIADWEPLDYATAPEKIVEDSEPEWVKRKRKDREVAEKQQYYIDHPEECPQ